MSWRQVIPWTWIEIQLRTLIFALICMLAGVGAMQVYYLYHPQPSSFEQGADWMLEKIRKEGITVERVGKK